MAVETVEIQKDEIVTNFNPIKFDWIYSIFLFWFSAGLFIDTWAHVTYGLELEGFFTPWHAVLYTGYGMTAGVLVYFTLKHKAMGLSLRDAIPNGYFGSAIGLIIFNIGGIGDGFWHEMIGIEVNTDGFYSPPHLTLLTGALLMWFGPFRAAWKRSEISEEPLKWLPGAISLGLGLSLFTFFYQYGFLPVSLQGTGLDGIRPENPTGNNLEGLASLGVILSSLTISFVMLLLLKRWNKSLPFGYFTVALTIMITGLSFVYFVTINIPIVFLIGLLLDAFYKYFVNNYSEVTSARILGFIFPFTFYVGILLSWLPQYDIWFNTSMYLGLMYVAGMIGFLASYLVYTPEYNQNVTKI